MVDAARARKLADRIQQIVAEMLERRIKDPRLGFVTVTDTRITNDLRDATVYYTVYGSDGERAETAAALESAKGVIRSEVGRQTGVRHTPSITFVMDSLMENVAHIDDLLAKARARDAEVAKAAQGASPAGDPNPYREPSGDDGDEGEDGEAAAGAAEGGAAEGGEDGRQGRPSS
ncbi:30S ribosome-binding factor RbfA [Actinomadura rubrisoli]|uniref:Ribosome-binding factor A n=1 Tax=Actinomadura rubrisoli TaxID=2530368 RepID=A0A4R5BXR6_9ACTN|nr:30S ribosome-binding factor RbfA [Actinomadura rubrisoli]TDD90999.1 30S ribosome-binding factor RbfA [Actinomadura rubrisoli]